MSSCSAAAHIMASRFPPPNYIDDCSQVRRAWGKQLGLRRCLRAAQILINDTAGSTSTTTSDLIARAHKLGLQVHPVCATP